MVVTNASTCLFRSAPSHRVLNVLLPHHEPLRPLERYFDKVFLSLRIFFTAHRGGSLGTRLAKQQLQSRELRSNVHVFVIVIYPLSSVFVNYFA